MNNPSTVVQEPSPVFDSLVSQLGRFAFASRFRGFASDGQSSSLSNFAFSDSVSAKRLRANASLSLSTKNGSSVRKFVVLFNRAVRLHCERVPIGFASVGAGSGDNNGSGSCNNGGGDSNGNGLKDDCVGVLEEGGLAFNGGEAESPKRVLILMSDTGGGHRASAEAIKAAFNEEFGEEYQVSHGVISLSVWWLSVLIE